MVPIPTADTVAATAATTSLLPEDLALAAMVNDVNENQSTNQTIRYKRKGLFGKSNPGADE